ncbi:MAG: hypothetical protein CL681_01625 [Blastopirellula sp.]|nr:hypothetical protein [Blastopirellula sp.]MAR08658.1 hypothetical protein [Blastopirellula sp.]|tara:strand:- start:5372 stop:6424 length:1053 start_codon:yes stop_codon:yes gene_type:complete
MKELFSKDVRINDSTLAKALKLSLEKLYLICDELRQVNEVDTWHLNEGEHYHVLNAHLGTLSFTAEGVIQLAKYTEETIDSKDIWRRIMNIIDRSKAKLVQSLVMTRVSEISEKPQNIVISNGRAFVTTGETRRILRLHTRQDILEKARNFEQTGDSGRSPMQPNKHFLVSLDHKHELYSAEGIKRLSMGLQNVCKSKTTKTWNKAVESTIFQTLKEVTHPFILEEKGIANTINIAKKLAGQKCEITGLKKSKVNPYIELCGHHLFDKSTNPSLSKELKNIIVIEKKLHRNFHEYMGGTHAPCTPKDFHNWLISYSGEIFGHSDKNIDLQTKAINNLKNRMKILNAIANE